MRLSFGRNYLFISLTIMRINKSISIAVVPLIVCFLLACSLWLYASMREEYTAVVDIPLEIRLPAGRTLETEVATSIRAQVQGAGWQLVNHFLSASIRCVVYVPEKRLVRGEEEPTNITISRQMLTQAIQSPVGIALQRIMVDSLLLSVGSIVEKRVAVRPVLDIEMREGFIVAEPPSAVPDSIVIRGSRTMLRRMPSWNTSMVRLRDMYEGTHIQTTLDDTLSGLITVPQIPVNVTLTIQQMAEVRFDDIPVRLLGAPARHSFVVMPERVSVTLRGGVENIARLLPENVTAALDYLDVLASTTGTLRPRIVVPTEVQVISVSPQFLRSRKRLFLAQKRE
jgi:hypothetical protein